MQRSGYLTPSKTSPFSERSPGDAPPLVWHGTVRAWIMTHTVLRSIWGYPIAQLYKGSRTITLVIVQASTLGPRCLVESNEVVRHADLAAPIQTNMRGARLSPNGALQRRWSFGKGLAWHKLRSRSALTMSSLDKV